MVSSLGIASGLLGLLLAQQKPQLTKLDPPTRAKVLAALAGLIILWFGVVAIVWLGGRFARRYMNSGEPSRRDKEFAEDWASKPLIPKDRFVKPDDEEQAE